MPEGEFFARFDVPLPDRVSFEKDSLPTSIDDAIVIELPKTHMKFCVWVPDEPHFVYEATPEEINRVCRVVRVLIAIQAMNEDLWKAIATHDPRRIAEGPVLDFVQNLYEQVLRIVNRICRFVRDELGHFTMDTIELGLGNQFFQHANAAWSVDGNKWDRLPRPPDDAGTVVMYSSMIDSATWRELGRFLKSDNDTDTTRHLIANAKSSAFHGDYRSAVIEAAIALEREAGFTVQDFLEERSLPTGRLTGKESSLTLLVTVWVPLVHPDIESNLLDAAKKVVDCRNEIIHPGRRRIPEEFREYIQKTVQLVQQLQNRRVAAPANK